MFHWVEGWSYLDSFYFSAISATTVAYGDGDFSPKTPAGKLLAVVYIFCGIGLLVTLVTRFAEALIQSERENQERLHLHWKHVSKKLAPQKAGAAQPGSAASPGAGEEHLP